MYENGKTLLVLLIFQANRLSFNQKKVSKFDVRSECTKMAKKILVLLIFQAK